MEFIFNVFNLYYKRFDFFAEIFIEHLVLSFLSIFIITVVGLFVGILITKYEGFAAIVMSFINFIYTIPSIALFGVFAGIIGIGFKTALIALIIYGLLPMIRNTYTGIKEIDPLVIESAKAMGSTDKQLLLKVELPLALPVIFAGFRTMVVMTIALAGIASFIGAGGLGVAIWRGITTYYPEMTVAGSLLVAGLAVVIDLILGFFEKKIRLKFLGN